MPADWLRREHPAKPHTRINNSTRTRRTSLGVIRITLESSERKPFSKRHLHAQRYIRSTRGPAAAGAAAAAPHPIGLQRRRLCRRKRRCRARLLERNYLHELNSVLGRCSLQKSENSQRTASLAPLHEGHHRVACERGAAGRNVLSRAHKSITATPAHTDPPPPPAPPPSAPDLHACVSYGTVDRHSTAAPAGTTTVVLRASPPRVHVRATRA